MLDQNMLCMLFILTCERQSPLNVNFLWYQEKHFQFYGLGIGVDKTESQYRQT